MDYYQSIFKASKQGGSMVFLRRLEGRVKNSMNEDLSKAFTREEMKPMIAPDPDSMAPIFFQ